MAARGQPQRETIPSDFYRQNPWDVRTYPMPRTKRSGPPAASGLGTDPNAPIPAPFPQSRVFAFAVGVNPAQRRSSTSSPRLIGPAIVRGLHITVNGGATGNFGFGLGKSAVSISEDSVAETVPLPFTPLFLGLPRVALGPTSTGQTDVMVDVQNPCPVMDDDSLGIIIPDAEFFLVVYAAGAGVINRTMVGHVNLLEQVPAELLPFYMS